MAEDETNEQESWVSDFLSAGDSEPEEKYEELAEEYEEPDKIKQMTHTLDEMQKKFDENMISMRIEKFMDSATENQKMLFKAVASGIKDVKTLDKMMATAREKGAAMDEMQKKVEDELEQKRAASIWSTPGSAPRLSPDEEAEIDERIKSGDPKAALHKLFEGDKLLGNYF